MAEPNSQSSTSGLRRLRRFDGSKNVLDYRFGFLPGVCVLAGGVDFAAISGVDFATIGGVNLAAIGGANFLAVGGVDFAAIRT